ncbi:unnamed protein product, partial [Cyprideis torosa]
MEEANMESESNPVESSSEKSKTESDTRQPEEEGTGVYIQGIVKGTTEETFRQYFQNAYGKVLAIELPRDPTTMDCLGYGTIHFQQRKSAMQAVKNLGGLGYHIRLSEAPELDESNIYFS